MRHKLLRAVGLPLHRFNEPSNLGHKGPVGCAREVRQQGVQLGDAPVRGGEEGGREARLVDLQDAQAAGGCGMERVGLVEAG